MCYNTTQKYFYSYLDKYIVTYKKNNFVEKIFTYTVLGTSMKWKMNAYEKKLIHNQDYSTHYNFGKIIHLEWGALQKKFL